MSVSDPYVDELRNGETLFPPEAEALASRANNEAQRACNAEAEIERLRAELAALKRGS